MNAPVAKVDLAKVNPDIKGADLKEMNFRFKKDDMGNQRAPVKLQVPVPNADGIIAILENGGKEYELAIEAFYDLIRGVVADMVANKPDISQENLDLKALSWAAIANMPKEDRRSSNLPQEMWDGFVKDYLAVMPGLTGKTEDQVKAACEVYVRKFGPWKSQHNIIKKLKEQLALYAQTPNAEKFSEVLDFLVRRADSYLASNDLEAIANNL
jgi:hypothetical protein